eukprot:TRINITY_DN6394_c0_g1_i2.p2 TRINITY_DN6394_c0_g1~~TRINITY_DN6394_c0_g1_i2.p2  ORF type:complete len:208 (-),score=53.20 TRINITY_DN6394_c0_g1_i2:356-979(-)
MSKWNPEPASYFKDLQNEDCLSLFRDPIYSEKTITSDHPSLEKTTFSPDIINSTETLKIYFVSPQEIWLESKIQLAKKVIFHDCLHPRRLILLKQLQNSKGQPEIEISANFTIEFKKSTIFFNGIIEKAGKKEFEYTLKNNFEKNLKNVWTQILLQAEQDKLRKEIPTEQKKIISGENIQQTQFIEQKNQLKLRSNDKIRGNQFKKL